jgi:hypothetical protein
LIKNEAKTVPPWPIGREWGGFFGLTAFILRLEQEQEISVIPTCQRNIVMLQSSQLTKQNIVTLGSRNRSGGIALTEETWISKKDLLQETGISYGQLYRWKRQKLIPDAWFVKQSSYTGQETYLPRERILERVQAILDRKDVYSLEQLAEMFAPEESGRTFSIEEMGRWINMETLTAQAVARKHKGDYAFLNLLFLYMGNRLEKNQLLNEHTADRWAEATLGWIPRMKGTAYRLIIMGKSWPEMFLLVGHDTEFFPEPEMQVLVDWDMDKEAKQLADQLEERR